MGHLRLPALALLAATLGSCGAGAADDGRSARTPTATKPRVVVTTDPELDDANSLVRYLLFSTDFQTEALIHASSGFHWKGDGKGTKRLVPGREYTRFGLHLCPCASWRWPAPDRHIEDVVDAYARVYRNLTVHDPNYPSPAELRSKIYWGNVEFDGDISQDTPGSARIRDLLLDDGPGPIYLLAWGGESTIARALKSIQEQFQHTPQWPTIYRKVSGKAILSPSGDQDDTYATYIAPNWPDIRTLPAGVGGVDLAYGAQDRVSAEDSVYYGEDWTRRNISGAGPLGALYRVWGDGKQMVKGDIFDYFGLSGYTAEGLRAMGYVVWLPPHPKGEFLGEGDTFTYLNLIDNGLSGYRDSTPGGWAGHGPVDRALRSDTARAGQIDQAGASPAAGITGRRPPSAPDFTAAAQNALAARLRWSVTPTYAGANHEPRVDVPGGLRRFAPPGATVQLRGVVSDPDGNRVRVRWWQWKEVGSYAGDVSVSDPTALLTSVRVPADARPGQTIQLILEVTDDGAPPLTRYQRVVLIVVG